MHGGDDHNPLANILGAMRGFGMRPEDVNQMHSMLEPFLGDGKGVPTPRQVEQLQFLGFDMAQLPNITLGEFGLHWLFEHRGYGDPVHCQEIVKWSERDEPIFITNMAPTSFNWVHPCHSEHEHRIQEAAVEAWGKGTFKVLTQDEINEWWATYRLSPGWHDLRPECVSPESVHVFRARNIGRVLINDKGEPEKVQWFKNGGRHRFKDAVAIASALSGYEIKCSNRYDDPEKTTKLVRSYTRRDAPMQHPNGEPRNE